MVRVVIIGQGMAATHFAVGLERLKQGTIEPYGIPFAETRLPVSWKDLRIVGAFDVDARKVGKSVYDIATGIYGFEEVPETLRGVPVYPGIEMGRARDLGFPIKSLDAGTELHRALDRFAETLASLRPDVVIDVSTTQRAEPVRDIRELEESIYSGRGKYAPSQYYAYTVLSLGEERPVAYVNLIPVPVANSPGIVEMAGETGLVLGDDGATGATPLTADLLEHLRERGRRVRSIAQFNIGGNTDFLALTEEGRNRAKEFTKSSVVSDILGYEPPHYIRPTGYLEPLGDRKFVAMHVEYISFNGVVDEIVVNMRINDSPALAGYMVDLARISKILLDRGVRGTVYEVNAFFMKKPGPPGSRSIARILAYHQLRSYLSSLGIVAEEAVETRGVLNP